MKFVHTFEVTYVLSKWNQLQQPISIKPDMSRDERASEAAWSLIQECTDCKSIKQQNNEIYIKHRRLEKSSNGFYIVTRATSPSHDVLLVNNTNTASSSVAVQDNVMHTSLPSSPQSSPSKLINFTQLTR